MCSSLTFYPVFYDASSDTRWNFVKSHPFTVLIRFLSRRFPTAERLPELRQFPICPVLGSQTNAYFYRCLFKCFPSLFRQFLSACLTLGRNHRFSYPPFHFLPSPYGFLLCRIPTAACRFPSAIPYVSIGVFSVFFWKKLTFFVAFFLLYLYYNKKMEFVNRFLKIFLQKSKIFFDVEKDGRIIFFRPSTFL